MTDSPAQRKMKRPRSVRMEKLKDLICLARKLATSSEGMTLDEIKEFMGVDRRTADRYRNILGNIFFLDSFDDGRKKRFVISSGFDRFFQAPTVDELAALQSAIHELARKGDEGRSELFTELSKKIETALRQKDRSRMEPDVNALVIAEGNAMQAGPRPTADKDLLRTIRYALKAGNMMRFFHVSPKGRKERVVSPWGLLYGKAYYLVGVEAGADQPVLWRLDRLEEVSVLQKSRFPHPDNWTLQDYANRSFGVWQDDPHEVSLRFSPKAAVDARRFLFHPTQKMVEEEDGSLSVTFTASGLKEMAYHLFSWGPEVTILAPTELRTLLQEMCRNVLGRYEGE